MRVLLAALLIGAASSSWAAGRAACRVDLYPLRAACYAEERVVALGPLEVAGGLEVRLEGGGMTAYPYLAFLLQSGEWWGALSLGIGYVSLSVGILWR